MRWPTKFPYTTINNINLDWIIKQVKAFAGQLAGKQDAPASAGTSGQVLGLDADLNPVWVDQSGGGGTSDYNTLNNKPQINSVTLTGNKTASDLGLATDTALSDLENDVTRAFSEIDALPADTAPLMDGTAAAGISAKLSRADHVHPTDTSRAAQTTVDALPADTAPLMDGTAAAGVSAKLSRADHVHPTDTSRAAQTTVDALPADTAPLMDGTAAAGISAKLSRADHVHPADTSKQDTLVSGTNIKTIGGHSILGSGDIAAGDTLYFQNVSCSVLTGIFATINNAAIKAAHVLADIQYSNPSAIRSQITWSTSDGTFTISGTCADTTTANIVLVLKSN